jgi:hypothetical protein
MSAANAIEDNKDAAPATTKIFTLRIGFVLLAGEADGPTSKLTPGRCHQMFKRRLTLILKVDFSRTRLLRKIPLTQKRWQAPQSLMKC